MGIDGATGLTGIFGDPVAHSASPAMHNAAYQALGMNRLYVPFHVVASHLPAALRAITAFGLLGVNVTVPHKERVARLLKRQSAEARALGAVNCVFPRAGELFGDNTDARGLAADLAALSAPIKGRTVILIGAGGGAPQPCSRCGGWAPNGSCSPTAPAPVRSNWRHASASSKSRCAIWALSGIRNWSAKQGW